MLNYYERYQPDIMIAFNDLAKEAEALGCRVKYSDYVVPSIDQHVLQDDKGKLARLEMPDPFKDGRLPAFLEQCEALSAREVPERAGRRARGAVDDRHAPAQPRADVPGHASTTPTFVHELMRFSTEYAKRWGDAVLTTKIGLSYTDPTASCSLVGPDTYREFIKPYHQEMVNYFKAKKVGTTIHICGTTHQIHEDLVDVGFVAITIDLDQQADPALQVDQLDKLVTLGNQRRRGGGRQRRRDHLRAGHPGRDRGRGAALHRHGRHAVALRALHVLRAAAARQPRLRPVVHGRGARLRTLRPDLSARPARPLRPRASQEPLRPLPPAGRRADSRRPARPGSSSVATRAIV